MSRLWSKTVDSPLNAMRQLLEVGVSRVATRSNLAAVLSLLIPCMWLIQWRIRTRNGRRKEPGAVSDTIGVDAITTDPGLLRKHASYASYHVPGTGITYQSIRTFYRPHPQEDKLPSKPTPIPLLVFIHGLGGSIAQFHPLLTSLVNLAPCLAVDLPGCGLSRFEPQSWSAYTPDSLAQLLVVIINKHRDIEKGQGVVLVSHSMGCSLGAILASSTSPYSSLLSELVLGMIGICPTAEPPGKSQTDTFRKLFYIPGPIFDLWRQWDRRGGTESASVARFTGSDAEEETKKLQVRFNEQSRTPVWRRMASGLLPDYSTGKVVGGIPGEKVWAGVRIPLFLVAGEADHIAPAINVNKIAKFLGQEDKVRREDQAFSTGSFKQHSHLSERENTAPEAKRSVFEGRIFAAPASHALMYSQRTARPLSAHIQTFLAAHIDYRLSLGWQLHHLTTEGKWDVKNLEKWQAVDPVSPPIAGVFRAMKTLREVDDSHSPKIFVKEWAPSSFDAGNHIGKDGLGAIAGVVDISHESPVYDPRGLSEGGIEYHKFPTVSKFPPTVDEVKHFVDLIDELRHDLLPEKVSTSPLPSPVIAVHCHYGFNRTGFFIISYMIERLHWTPKAAFAEFADKRPNGVRHEHFVDELWGRYWTREREKS